jgi:hypothetical protein
MTRYGLGLLTVSLAAACAGNDNMVTGGASASVGDDGTDDASADETTSDTSDDADEAEGGSTGDSDDNGDSSSDGSADESTTAANDCEQAQFAIQLEPLPPNVMLVLDKSRSMTNPWDHDLDASTPEISRWHSLHNVVADVTAQFSDTIHFGSILFPSADAWLDEPTNEFSCLVNDAPEVPVGVMTRDAILGSMPDPLDLTISGGTPAAAGVQNAVDHLLTLPDDAPRAVLLLTDGAANCNPDEAPQDTLFVYDAQVPLVVAQAFGDHAIPTYVIGINILDELGTKPAVNPHVALNTVAEAGGAPSSGADSFYNSFNEIELAEALQAVAMKIECTVSLPEEPEFPDLAAVSVDGQPWDQIGDCAAGDGWTYTNPVAPFNAIELCGAACDALQGGGTVQVEYGCPE